MGASVSRSRNHWMDAVALIFAVSIGATLISINRSKISARPPATLPTQTLVVTVPNAPVPLLPAQPNSVRSILVMMPMVKAELLADDMLYPSANPSLNTINVDTDEDGETLILKGTVRTQSMKQRAQSIAEHAIIHTAYTINNQLTVSSH